MKKLLVLILAGLLIFCFAGCSNETKTLHCDECGTEIEADAKSEMNDEDWILFCEECEKEKGLNDFFTE